MTDRTLEREWPPNFYACTSRPHMEALGIIATIYNHLEDTLFLLILIYSELEYDVAKIRFPKMDNSKRVEFLLKCSQSRTEDNLNNNPMHEHVINFLECYGIVAGNRNTLMHSIILATHKEGVLSFFKESKAKPTVGSVLLLDMSSLRQTAYDLQDVTAYGAEIWLNCNSHAPWSRYYQSPKKMVGLGLSLTPARALEKLALPRKLLMPVI
jgi:hypothetical protein